MAKYEDGFSVDQRNIVFISSQDPRAQGWNLGKTKLRMGRTVRVVDEPVKTLSLDKASLTNLPIFLAIASDTLAYSPNGTSWNTLSMPGEYPEIYNSYDHIASSNKLIVATSSFTPYRVAYSSNGLDWTVTIPSPTLKFNAFTYGSNKFIGISSTFLVDRYVHKASISSDGVNWTTSNIQDNYTSPYIYGQYRSLIYGNDRFVAVGDNGHSSYSSDGISWVDTGPIGNNYGYDWYKIAYGENKFVALRSYTNTSEPDLAYSSDGTTWTLSYLNTSKSWYSITYGNNKFVATGRHGFAYSSDGINWTEIPMPVVSPINQDWMVTYGNGIFVALSYDYGRVATSVDGITWSLDAQTPGTGYWLQLTSR